MLYWIISTFHPLLCCKSEQHTTYVHEETFDLCWKQSGLLEGIYRHIGTMPAELCTTFIYFCVAAPVLCQYIVLQFQSIFSLEDERERTTVLHEESEREIYNQSWLIVINSSFILNRSFYSGICDRLLVIVQANNLN